jgi:hypothetical protein
MGEQLSSATIDLSKLRGVLGLTEEQAGKLEEQFGSSWQGYAQALANAITEEKRIREDGARGTAKSFADQNVGAIKALKDFETNLRKVISNMDIATKIDIATSGAAFGSEFKRTKSTGRVDILQALGFEKAASDLTTQNIYQDTIGKQKTEGSAEIDQAIKSALNTAFLSAIPKTQDVKSVGDFNSTLAELGNLSGVTGNQDFSKKIQDASADIASIPKKTVQGGPLGSYEQFDTEGIISALNDKKVEKEELQKLRDKIDNTNKLIPKAQQDAAIKTVQRIDELIKVTIAGLSGLGGSLDSMINDGGMGDGSASEKFTEAVDNYTATMKDPKATPEQKAQAAREALKAKQNLGLDVKTDDPAYKVVEQASQTILENQRKSVAKNLGRLGEDTTQFEQKAMQLGGGSIQEGIRKSAQVKVSTDLKPVNASGSQKIIADAEKTVLTNLEKSGPEGKVLADNYKKALEASKKAPEGVSSLETVFKTQTDTSNGYLNQMVNILTAMTGGVSSKSEYDPFNKFSGPSLARTYLDTTDNNRESIFSPGGAEDRVSAIEGIGDPREKLGYRGDIGPTVVNSLLPRIEGITKPTNDYMKGAFEGMPVPLNVNSPITISINATSQKQGEQIQAALQGVDQEVIDVINSRLSKVEAITAATVTRDPSLNPPPKQERIAKKSTFGAMGGFGPVQ